MNEQMYGFHFSEKHGVQLLYVYFRL